jgi:hypothetical protein
MGLIVLGILALDLARSRGQLTASEQRSR